MHVGRVAKQERSVVRNPRLYVHYREFSLYKVCASSTNVFPHSTNYTGNGYKHSVQRFLASFEWTSVTCDWLMVVFDTIDSTNHNWGLSTETIPEITATNTCTHSPSSFRSGELPFFVSRRRVKWDSLSVLTLPQEVLTSLVYHMVSLDLEHFFIFL